MLHGLQQLAGEGPTSVDLQQVADRQQQLPHLSPLGRPAGRVVKHHVAMVGPLFGVGGWGPRGERTELLLL